MVWLDPGGSSNIEGSETLGFQSLLLGLSFRGSSSLYAPALIETLLPAACISLGRTGFLQETNDYLPLNFIFPSVHGNLKPA